MQHLEVSGAVRSLKWSLGVKWLSKTPLTYMAVGGGGGGGGGEVNVSYYTAVLFVQHCMRYDITGRKRNKTG